MDDANINTILGERLNLASTKNPSKFNVSGQRVVLTENGREIAADLIVSFPPLPFITSNH